MRAVLVGADLMYRKDGKLVPIEINTNVALDFNSSVEHLVDSFDLEELANYIKDNNITSVYLEGNVSIIFRKLKELVEGLDVQILPKDEFDALEDDDSTLMVRTHYSDDAFVDSFCRDKITFLDSISSQEIGSEYLLKTVDGFEGDITEVPNYPVGIPNFILKYRYPNYSKDEYPKLYRFDSLEDLEDFAESDEMPEDFFLMPYYYCENSLYSGRIRLIRDLSIFVSDGEGLTSIEVGKYTKLCGKLELQKVKYDESCKLGEEYRNMFLDTRWIDFSSAEKALLDEGDLVWMSDGSWKPVEQLKVGDLVKSLEVPAKEGYNTAAHVGNYGVTLQELETETQYVDNEVTRIAKASRLDDITNLKFDDNSDWYDTSNSSYPTINEDGFVEFKRLKALKEGDTIILISLKNSSMTPKFTTKTISEISTERVVLEEGYALELTGSHLFISRVPGDEEAYAAIEHNATCWDHCSWVSVNVYEVWDQNDYNYPSQDDFCGCCGDNGWYPCMVNVTKTNYGCYCMMKMHPAGSSGRCFAYGEDYGLNPSDITSCGQ